MDVNYYPVIVNGGDGQTKLAVKQYVFYRLNTTKAIIDKAEKEEDLGDDYADFELYKVAVHRQHSAAEEMRKLRLLNYLPMAEDFIPTSSNVTDGFGSCIDEEQSWESYLTNVTFWMHKNTDEVVGKGISKPFK